MKYKVRQQLQNLSLTIFGVSSKWRKLMSHPQFMVPYETVTMMRPQYGVPKGADPRTTPWRNTGHSQVEYTKYRQATPEEMIKMLKLYQKDLVNKSHHNQQALGLFTQGMMGTVSKAVSSLTGRGRARGKRRGRR